MNQSLNQGFVAYSAAQTYSILGANAYPPSSVTSNSATLNGQVAGTGGAENPYAYFCWGFNDAGTNSLTAWNHADLQGTDWSGGQSFSTNLTNLPQGSNYFYRCFVSNSLGTAWSSQVQTFSTVKPKALARSL